MDFRFILVVVRLTGIFLAMLWAQSWYEPALRSWQALEVGPVVVWYVEGSEGLAEQVGQWGADAYRELVGLLEFEPQAKIIIRLYPSPQSWAQAPVPDYRGALMPPPTIASIYPFPSRAQIAALTRSEVAVLLLQQLYFSEGVRMQNRALLYMPDWFLRGFGYFWGEGWTREDLVRLQDIPEEAFVEIVERRASPSPFYKSLYKSIWFWIYRTYGQRKTMDLLYMTRLTRSIGEALYLTLNLSETELWEKWQSFLGTLKGPELRSEEELERRGIIAAAVASDGETRAFATLRDQRVQYYLRLNGNLYELPGSWQWRSGYYDPALSMSFSNQKSLVWTTYEKDRVVLRRWSPLTRKYEQFPLPLLAVQGIAWQGESTLLFSGLSPDGSVKVYALTLPQGNLRIVAQAKGDLLYPEIWQSDLYAMWQPDTAKVSPLSVLWEPLRPVRLEKNEWRALSYPSFYATDGGWIVHDSALTSVSDIMYGGHPWTFLKDTSYAGEWAYGGVQQWVGSSPERVFFLRYRGGKMRLASAPRSNVLNQSAIFPPISAAEVIQLRLQRKGTYVAFYAPPIPRFPEDTVASDTPRQRRQPFYLFDEEVSRPRRRRSRSRTFELPSADRIQPIPTARFISKVPYHWGLWELRLEPVLHPMMRLGWQTTAVARDWQGDHEWSVRWTPYIDLRSSELVLSYTRYRSRLQPFAQLYKQSHYFPARRYNHTLRITTWQGKLGIRYPISPAWTIEGYVVGLYANRYHVSRTTEQNLSAQTQRLGGGIQIVQDKLSLREGFPWIGWQNALRLEGYFSRGQWSYPMAYLNIQRYQPLLNRMVLHLGGTAVAGGQRGRYFLLGGVPEWINYVFENRAQIPLLTEPVGYFLTEYAFVPGFPYHARRGRNLILGSAKVHMPMLAWRREMRLPSRQVYGFDWYLSYYIGTTWTTGNPFSQKNPIDAEFIFRPPLVISVQALKSPFIASFGTGIVFQVMRLPISVEVAWPIEEGRITKATFIAGLRRNF
ncbi:MAG: hypothetical protein N2200_08035 [Bacteroidia bacterium]|nr:hypothetical protein [Bacteroidia bacterium]MDW8417216.1 hypothetical protein [Bacteroidia bacterium]